VKTDNVASATKLQTARTIWGQSFNGTADVSGAMTGVGNITVNGGSMITTSTTDTSDGKAWYGLTFGTETTYKRTTLSGYFGMWFRTGGASYYHVFTGGNVGINTTAPSYSLHVTGTAYITGATKIDGATTFASTVTAPSFVGNLSGTATAATALNNLFSSRPTTMDVNYSDGGLRTFKATSSTTTNKPADDSHIIHLSWDNNGGYESQIAVTAASGNFMQYRRMYAGTWGSWLTLLDSGNYGSYALPISGGTMTGVLVASYGSSLRGVKVGGAYINAIDNRLILQNVDEIRFGTTTGWDWDGWGGLKYIHSAKTIYLGIADGSYFTKNNTAQTGGTVKLVNCGLYVPDASQFFGEQHFAASTYIDPWSGTDCAAKFSGNVGIGGNLLVTGSITATNFIGSASKLGSSTIGSLNNPIYLSNGSPVACN
jgi:hypothetical protein